MGKQSKRGRSRSAQHVHSKTGEGKNSHHRLHSGPYYKSHHHQRSNSQDSIDDASPPDQNPDSLQPGGGNVIDVDQDPSSKTEATTTLLADDPKSNDDDDDTEKDPMMIPLVLTASTDTDLSSDGDSPKSMDDNEQEHGAAGAKTDDDDDDDDDHPVEKAVVAAAVGAGAVAATAAIMNGGEETAPPPATSPPPPPPTTTTSGEELTKAAGNDTVVDVDDPVVTITNDETTEAQEFGAPGQEEEKEEIVDVDEDPGAIVVAQPEDEGIQPLEQQEKEDSSTLLGWAGAFAATAPPPVEGEEEEVHFEHPEEEEVGDNIMPKSQTNEAALEKRTEEEDKNQPSKPTGNFFSNARKDLRAMVSNKESDKKRQCSPYCKYGLIALALCAIIFILAYVLASTTNDNDGDDNDDIDSTQQLSTDHHGIDSDHHSTEEEITPWKTSGNGLEMKVMMSLDVKWLPYYVNASKAWDSGYPDAVSIMSKPIPYEKDCTQSDGFLKICNGDYGATGWRTINDYVVTNGYMVSNSARINENYVGDPQTDGSDMQYAMCHVLGHGLGLVHIEGFPELGECASFGRDTRNYELLYRLYGLVPGAEAFPPPDDRRRRRLRGMSPTRDLGVSSKVTRLRGSLAKKQSEQLSEDWLGRAVAKFYDGDRGQRLQHEKWRLLSRSEQSELHEVELSSAHKLRVFKMFV
mmetsp:Transcript_5861/g.14929  ORF Transcript_5861/g.14929 Transcript_5861/m.14929 type:complete len:690 (-) Transcript_5861:986-3055(-)|eukprot:CAMPEP_0168734726 /NCGR_PEP_ID=MMETSP0724-20121128/8963_1 /TAXON_ID=265536 /ORGANISM="Amphiprora sp., Strain CCMP467" /LENGTH=689 /DNA_ID=CAMNT_0008781841 /DNA_START=140 /DNA_END=2209 /DNA_ORIENTATION=-